jgi:hypothetical protein
VLTTEPATPLGQLDAEHVDTFARDDRSTAVGSLAEKLDSETDWMTPSQPDARIGFVDDNGALMRFARADGTFDEAFPTSILGSYPRAKPSPGATP